MDLFSKKDIQGLLKTLNIAPSKGLGQNFLISKGIAKKIIDAADIKPDDVVLEVGPGIGNLTLELAKSAKQVVAVEKDKKMVEILQKTLKDCKNVEIINEDILKLNPNAQIPMPNQTPNPNAQKVNWDLDNLDLIGHWSLGFGHYKVVANLPYYITSPTIRMFLESDVKIDAMVLTIQKEVAQRICAKPPEMSILAVSVQFYAEPKIISYIKKENFWPRPKVDSAIIKLEIKDSRYQIPDSRYFFKVVKAGFSHPRKQLVNNLSGGLRINKEKVSEILRENGIKPEQRAETLTVEQWKTLANNF